MFASAFDVFDAFHSPLHRGFYHRPAKRHRRAHSPYAAHLHPFYHIENLARIALDADTLARTDAFDPEVDFPRHMAMSPRCVEWGARMRAFQTPAPEAKEGDWWTYMECVFDLGARDRSKPGYRNSD